MSWNILEYYGTLWKFRTIGGILDILPFPKVLEDWHTNSPQTEISIKLESRRVMRQINLILVQIIHSVFHSFINPSPLIQFHLKVQWCFYTNNRLFFCTNTSAGRCWQSDVLSCWKCAQLSLDGLNKIATAAFFFFVSLINIFVFVRYKGDDHKSVELFRVVNI